MIREGQIVLFRFPQTDRTSGKLRPALVIRKLPGQYDDWLFIGNKDKSRRLRKPLPFNKKLATKLSLGINFEAFDKGERTELQVIGSSTRSHRQLTDNDVSILLDKTLVITT